MSGMNDQVPYQTMIRVMLRKIKLQEEEIWRLKNETEYLNGIISDMSDEEKKIITDSPLYRRLVIENLSLRQKCNKLKREEQRLVERLAIANKTIDDYFTA